MAIELYKNALRLGQKEFRNRLSDGAYPYLPVLDDILYCSDIVSEYPLGLVQIPSELIVGTKTAGRTTAFAANFMPLLKPDSEFAAKWEALCESHLHEGIRDPIKAYEFMNHFYVEEGNKRVSVLKYYDAVTIPGYVTRIVPRRSNNKKNKIYYEFLDFYKCNEINYLWFSKLGGFTKLQKLVGKKPGEMWSEDERKDFYSFYIHFREAFFSKGGQKLSITPGDAAVTYLSIYDYQASKDKLVPELKNELSKIWDEILLQTEDDAVDLLMDPTEVEESASRRLFGRFISSPPQKLNIAFVHEKSAETSGWTYAHELGRLHLDQVFSDQVSTSCIENVNPDDAEYVLEDLITTGHNLIFTTTPVFMEASLKAAIEHPEVKILNCSLNTPHRYIRTYYGRMYEAKFLVGALAGALTDSDTIGYIADYPIMGSTANINAYALGAKMVNPRAKVLLEWNCVKDRDPEKIMEENHISYISSQDMIIPQRASRKYGLYRREGNETINIAAPIWNWGMFYENIIRSIFNGNWKSDDSSEANRALNYWWGMSSEVIDVIFSKNLPAETKRLIDLLKENICGGTFNPFSGILTSQEGIVQNSEQSVLSPIDIIQMNWLADNVIGKIPDIDDLKESAKPVVMLQGIKKKG